MDPDQIRSRILEAHAHLRGQLEKIEGLTARFAEGDAGVGPALRARGLELYEQLARHIDFEDACLAPALRSAGEDGAHKAQSLQHEHHEQRELLKYLTGRLGRETLPTVLVARELENFAAYLRLDMQHEEETMLSELPSEPSDA